MLKFFGNENYFIKLIFVRPPSARISVPTIKDDSSEAKNTVASPISEGKPCLPIGVMSFQICFTCSHRYNLMDSEKKKDLQKRSSNIFTK